MSFRLRARVYRPNRRNEDFSISAFSAGRRDGKTIRVKVAGDADPGYLSTSKMLGQAAACLAALDKLEKPGGLLDASNML